MGYKEAFLFSDVALLPAFYRWLQTYLKGVRSVSTEPLMGRRKYTWLAQMSQNSVIWTLDDGLTKEETTEKV